MKLTRKERVKLLLGSYLDAATPGRSPGPDIARVFASRSPGRNQDLWKQGSYRPLERSLHELAEKERSVHWHVMEFYVRRNPRGARRRKADLGVDFLAKKMPRDIFVPQDITENAGFGASEAAAAARPDLEEAA